MLKLTYTSAGVTLERSVESLEAAIRRRVMLNLSMGEPLGLEPTSISLKVNRSTPMLEVLMEALSEVPLTALNVVPQAAQVEMQLQGYWLAQQELPGQGIFMTHLDPTLEGHLVKVWQASQQDVSYCA